ncbi:unnamed protein product [Brassica rapa]|uniref:Uncharacterized protein n=2 Tax=Brassica TaxID=3705 RepID=A0A8D9GI94_BRACM|nr:unnamed protein product [Brassica napus]CAG7881044.1 unnamed protein product [Brassica rapa]
MLHIHIDRTLSHYLNFFFAGFLFKNEIKEGSMSKRSEPNKDCRVETRNNASLTTIHFTSSSSMSLIFHLCIIFFASSSSLFPRPF